MSSGPQTVSSWLRAADVSDESHDHYVFVQTLGRSATDVATKRYGPKVELAGIHYKPSPDPPKIAKGEQKEQKLRWEFVRVRITGIGAYLQHIHPTESGVF